MDGDWAHTPRRDQGTGRGGHQSAHLQVLPPELALQLAGLLFELRGAVLQRVWSERAEVRSAAVQLRVITAGRAGRRSGTGPHLTSETHITGVTR